MTVTDKRAGLQHLNKNLHAPDQRCGWGGRKAHELLFDLGGGSLLATGSGERMRYQLEEPCMEMSEAAVGVTEATVSTGRSLRGRSSVCGLETIHTGEETTNGTEESSGAGEPPLTRRDHGGRRGSCRARRTASSLSLCTRKHVSTMPSRETKH